jgi:hypothetical protein
VIAHMISTYTHATYETDGRTASREGSHALLLAVLNTLKWPILSIILPRLAFAAFTFCQPLLISATLQWAETPGDSDDMNQGYGLIGAWFLVFVGIAVSATPQAEDAYLSNRISLTLHVIGVDWSVPAPHVPRHHHGPWSAHLNAL